MNLPGLTQAHQETLVTSTFNGYNRNILIEDGENYDELNLSDRDYPLLTQRAPRGITSFDPEGSDPVTLTAAHGRDNLIMVRGSEVFYNFVKVAGLSLSSAQPKMFVDMGAYTCVWPDKKYFNTADLTDCGSMERLKSYDNNTTGISISLCRGDGTDYDATEIYYGDEPPESPYQGALWMDTHADDADTLMQYDTLMDEWSEVYTVYVKIAATGIGAGLKQYDVITVSGLEAKTDAEQKIKDQIAALNGADIVQFCGENYIVIIGLLSETVTELKQATPRFDLIVPDLDYVCESNNRLWGCKYGLENGQFVNEIRASKLGDFRNWQCFMNLSTDSYTVSVGTDGPWTGAVTQRGYPVFFKEEYIHKVTGSMPSNYQTSVTACRGVQRGSWDSVKVVNEAVYYKARDAVMAYDGSMPVAVSGALGNELYSDACAGVMRTKYYICMSDRSGERHLFTLNTQNGIWHHEDGLNAEYFSTVGDELYCIDRTNNTLIGIGGSAHASDSSTARTETEIPWSATFGLTGTDAVEQKYLSRFNLRMHMEPGSHAHLWIEYDSDGDWTDEGEITGNCLNTFMIPVVPRRCDHMRVRITGTGPCKIFSIARILEVGEDGATL